MANLFPCPNAACTYQFDADQLPAAAMVTCPLCRTRFPYRAAAKPAPEAAQDEADDMGWAGPSPGHASSRVNRLVNPNYAPKGNKTQLYIMLIGGAAVLLTMAFIVARMSKEQPFRKSSQSIEAAYDMYNFKFETPGDDWTLDDGMKTGLDFSCFVYKRKESPAYAGLDAMEFFGRDKQPRAPYARELVDKTKEKLAFKFKELAIESIKGAQLAGRPADAFTFQGEFDGDTAVGEAYMMDYRGLGYSFVIWAKQDVWGGVRDELVKLRGKFQLGDGRADWKAKSVSPIFFEAGGNYQLEDEDGIWQKGEFAPPDKESSPKALKKLYIIDQEMLKAHDPNAAMLLRARYPSKDPRRARDLLPKVDAMVIVMDKPAGNPLEEAKNYVKNRVIQEEGADKVTFIDAKAPEKMDDLPANWNALARFTSKNSDSRDAKKFFVVNAIVKDDKLILIEVKSSEEHSEVMEPFMIRLAASLKERR